MVLSEEQQGADGGSAGHQTYEPAADRGRSFLRALENTGISVIYCDTDLKVLWTEHLPRAWGEGDIRGRRDEEFMRHEIAEQLTAAKRNALATGQPQTLEINLGRGSNARWFSVWIDLDRLESGAVRGIFSTAVDITEQKWREQTLRSLLRELAHRSKNLLAIIQSLATQTGRHADTVDGFLSRFRGRLQSLASTQDLITSSNWRGADLHELALGQVGRYMPYPAKSMLLLGEKPYLNPNAVLHVGLALHELVVNSLSYGALARSDGTVTLRADRAKGAAGPGLWLSWCEDISIGDQAIGQKRFGSIALERVVPASLNGQAILDISSEKLEYRLFIPSGHFEIG